MRAFNKNISSNAGKLTQLPRYMAALLVLSVLLFAASSAFAAPPRYAHRGGPVVGLGIGGSIGAVDMDREALTSDRDLGLALHGLIGAGVNDNIVLGLGINSWIHWVQLGSKESTHIQWDFLAQGDFYLFDGFYLEGGVGLAYAKYDAQIGNTIHEYGEMGFALRGGLGYEYFINGTHAVGLNAGYTRHFYKNTSFDTLGVGIGLRWY